MRDIETISRAAQHAHGLQTVGEPDTRHIVEALLAVVERLDQLAELLNDANQLTGSHPSRASIMGHRHLPLQGPST